MTPEQPRPSESKQAFKVDYKDLGGAALAPDLEQLHVRMNALAVSGRTPLLPQHVEGLLLAVRAGQVKLRGGDLDILEPAGSGAAPLAGSDGRPLSIDRNIAHLYFAPDGTFNKSYSAETGGKQLLHGVADVAIKIPDGRLVCIQWVDQDPAWRNIGIIGGHVPAGMQSTEAAKKEVPEELNWKGRLPEPHEPRGSFELVGSAGQFPAPNPGDSEAKTLCLYRMDDPEELALLFEEQARLDELRSKLGDDGFYDALMQIQRTDPGRGEIWAIHLLAPEDLADESRLRSLNAGVDLLGYLADPMARTALTSR